MDSILALSRANANEPFARAQAVHHAGAEEALTEVITLVQGLARGDTDA